MSTIASPRQSLTISSRRTSTDTIARSVSTSRTPLPPTGSLRRNRAALRDYYGLKAAQQEDDYPPPLPAEVEEISVIDGEGFDAEEYVKELLANESLESILRTEASLISETRTLDGEKKSLVYDNYSKLIAATETIRKMRTNMDPLAPTTSTLTPAISHIAATATALSESIRSQHGTFMDSDASRKAAEQKTVRWVLAAPERIKALVLAGQREGAEAQWIQVETLLNKWSAVTGVERVRAACQEALAVKG
ncbi:hypothetical protein AMS68_005710 [Peltaster fructicola]|uniref:Vacuolar protein sorting-associated protein 51 homolog n=1 Tax=Peltaster fructicola TaxID=286661 RepID=A0A6H0XZL0_9PEZI|nr:hypothetical protein AMS68_005710 [Peltaster fructicola]